MKIELAGVPATEFNAIKTLLTGPSGDACIEDGQPIAIKPASSGMQLKTSFDYEAPAQSLTVFRLRK
ncbi:MAG TPA: hypothetical protein VK327_08115 [Candidatus Paceibacterota bacterium]|nr:hypothetical protein [Candidatus Paceibacterota bacterium]